MRPERFTADVVRFDPRAGISVALLPAWAPAAYDEDQPRYDDGTFGSGGGSGSGASPRPARESGETKAARRDVVRAAKAVAKAEKKVTVATQKADAADENAEAKESAHADAVKGGADEADVERLSEAAADARETADDRRGAANEAEREHAELEESHNDAKAEQARYERHDEIAAMGDDDRQDAVDREVESATADREKAERAESDAKAAEADAIEAGHKLAQELQRAETAASSDDPPKDAVEKAYSAAAALRESLHATHAAEIKTMRAEAAVESASASEKFWKSTAEEFFSSDDDASDEHGTEGEDDE